MNNAKKWRKAIEWEKTGMFQKVGDIYQGNMHTRMGMIKDRKDTDLTEAGEIGKKRWHEYTEVYSEGISDWEDQDGVFTHLEQDILEYEVKWASGSITMNKTRGGDGNPAELFKFLKDDAVKVLQSVCQQI